jgi:mono/diheme cytochrome c family protein
VLIRWLTGVHAAAIALVLAACGSKAPPHATPAAPPPPIATPTPPASNPGSEPPPATPAAPSEPAPPAPDPKRELLAAETAAWETAKPVFTKYCARCHTKAGKQAARKKLEHFAMDSYPLGGHHSATIGFTIRDVLGITGKKPTMPSDKPGAVKGDELAAIKAWTDAWEAAEQGGAHPAAHDHHDHDHD